MRAIRFHDYGGPEVLRLEDVPAPQPGPGELQIAIAACGVNRWEIEVREGRSGLPIQRPFTLGYEVVGTVAATGVGVEEFRVGQRVMANLTGPCGSCLSCTSGREWACVAPGYLTRRNWGGFAERVVCPAVQARHVPDELGDAAAAALQVAFGTAWHMLFDRGRLRAGETVLVGSAGGVVAGAAVRLAHIAGARVIGTGFGPEDLDRARTYGMDVGIDHTSEDVVARVMELTDGAGADLAFEHVGGPSLRRSLDALAPGGRVVICGSHGGDAADFALSGLYQGCKSVIGSSHYTRRNLEALLELARRGLVVPAVGCVLALERVQEAMRRMADRSVQGKVVLTT